MKKLLSLLLVLSFLFCFLPSCGSESNENSRLSVVTTIFPEYDWVMNVLGEKSADADVTMLLDSGVDLHSFQPTADDIIRISRCNLFICVGGESDEWVEDALKEAVNKDMRVIRLLDVLGDGAKTEEIKEGMEAEDEDEVESEPEYDEHVWLSLKNAAVFVAAICDALCELDGENADTYRANTADYLEILNALDEKYREAAENAAVKTVLFGDRFPFRYLTDDYGLDYFAAFVGCSAESEASFETIAFLANKLDELSLPAILTLEGTNHKIAEAILAASDSKSAQLLTMDSMQSTTAKDVQNGVTYLSVMEKNLGVLSDALR